MDNLDLSAIEASYEGGGASSYNAEDDYFVDYASRAKETGPLISVKDAERNGRAASLWSCIHQ